MCDNSWTLTRRLCNSKEMCGRYASFRQAQDLADAFEVDDLLADALALPPSWNLAPTQNARIIMERAVPPSQKIRRQLRSARWGLVPSWAKDPSVGSKMINARAESLAQKPSFRRALAKQRCLVVADGYYEWHALPGSKTKTAYYLHPKDNSPLAFAGLYELWANETLPNDAPERWLITTTIITSAAVGELAKIHSRRPVSLPQEAMTSWLNPLLTDSQEALVLLDTPGPEFQVDAVSSRVNTVAINDASLIEPALSVPAIHEEPLPGFEDFFEP